MIARWALIPSWSKDAKNGAKTINARIESVAEKPSFRSAFKSRRCIIPADGYYEWYTLSTQGTKSPSPKQPFYIHRKDDRSLAMAGLYEYWRDPEGGDLIISATIITTSSEGQIASIHDRMPVLLPRDRYDAWLAPAPAPINSLLALLDIGGEDQHLVCDPVSQRVNSARNNGAELIEPLPFEEEPPLF
jgi:putative SOS response-associated peptidase YedK